mgnify:CR=1 FL=1
MREPAAKPQPGKTKAPPRLEPWSTVRSRLLANPRVRFEYDQSQFKIEIAEVVKAAREEAGLSQSEVAERAGTKQSVIARLESGRGGIPGLSLLDRVGRAIGLKMSVQLEPSKAA